MAKSTQSASVPGIDSEALIQEIRPELVDAIDGLYPVVQYIELQIESAKQGGDDVLRLKAQIARDTLELHRELLDELNRSLSPQALAERLAGMELDARLDAANAKS